MNRYQVSPHIPHGSGDAEYRIIDTERDGLVVAVVDPNMAMDDPAEMADLIAYLLNRGKRGRHPLSN